MDAPASQISSANSSGAPSVNAGGGDSRAVNPSQLPDDLAFKLGLWLSGLESFLNIRNQSFADERTPKGADREWTREFRLTNSTLLLCARLAFQLGKVLKDGQKSEADFGCSSEEVYKLSLAIKDAVLLNEAFIRAAPLRFGEWTAWSNLLSDKFKEVSAFDKLIKKAEQTGENAIPETLAALLGNRSVPLATQSDLGLVLPRLAKILKWLSVVGEMLRNDEPLKPSLLIFSRIYEQINEMTNYINNRLRRFPNEEDELFGVLDGAAYAASIELRKVFSHELAGIADIRTTPSIYAKIETAYSLLNDSFQLTLITFAQLLEPAIESEKIFPNLKTKLEQSIVLRQTMWEILQDIRTAEQEPEEFLQKKLHAKLTGFRDITQHFLFYKDKETVERFIEELLITKNAKDLVPILHRFSAYIETLFGQVNMRVVLAGHPFEQ